MYRGYNIFHTPHKVWRAALNELRSTVKSADFTDAQQVRNITLFAKHVFSAHHAHTQSENKVLGPALKEPGLAGHWIDVHDMHGEAVDLVHRDLELLERSSNPKKMEQLGKQLTSDLERFAAQDQMHTSLEEGFMTMFGRLYSEQELFDLDVKATSYWNNISEDAKEIIFPFFIRAHSGDDLVRILKIFKQILNDKPEAWQKFVGMAKKELKPGQITKFESMKLFE